MKPDKSVVITAADIYNHVFYESHAVARLREAGIPVKGRFVFGGVENGRLEQVTNPISGDIIFNWYAGQEA